MATEKLPYGGPEYNFGALSEPDLVPSFPSVSLEAKSLGRRIIAAASGFASAREFLSGHPRRGIGLAGVSALASLFEYHNIIDSRYLLGLKTHETTPSDAPPKRILAYYPEPLDMRIEGALYSAGALTVLGIQRAGKEVKSFAYDFLEFSMGRYL